MRYMKTVDIWALDDDQRRKLPVGQWVTAGPNGPKGRFMGQGRRTSVVAWLGNSRKGHWIEYMRAIRKYAIQVAA